MFDLNPRLLCDAVEPLLIQIEGLPLKSLSVVTIFTKDTPDITPPVYPVHLNDEPLPDKLVSVLYQSTRFVKLAGVNPHPVGDGVLVLVGVGVGVAVKVVEGVGVLVGVPVCVCVGVPVLVFVGVLVLVGVCVFVGVLVGVLVGVAVNVVEGVCVLVGVCVGVLV